LNKQHFFVAFIFPIGLGGGLHAPARTNSSLSSLSITRRGKKISQHTKSSHKKKCCGIKVKNYTQRNSSVSWNDITKEFMTDSGPVYSLFSDFSNKGEGAFGSLESYNSIYGLAARSDVLRSNKSKNTMAITTLYANPLSAGFDPWEQMIGEANISWYNLGNDVLFMLVDSKSNTSLYYHIPFINNKKRGQDGFGHGNTYQTYIWLETKKDIKQKNDFYLEMLQKRMEAIHR